MTKPKTNPFAPPVATPTAGWLPARQLIRLRERDRRKLEVVRPHKPHHVAISEPGRL